MITEREKDRIKEKLFYDILNDKTSGSSFIVEKIEALFELSSPEEIKHFSIKILKVHSSMAAVINEINFLLLRYLDGIDVKKPSLDEKIIVDFWRENDKLVRWATISMSRWVLRFFELSPKRLKIFIPLSRPEKEGLLMADKLKAFHEVYLFEDLSIFREIESVDAVISGADYVGERFFVNKTGTFSMLNSARYFGKESFLITTGDKFLSNELEKFYKFPELKLMKDEIIEAIFEKVPLSLVKRKLFLSKPHIFKTSSFLKNFI